MNYHTIIEELSPSLEETRRIMRQAYDCNYLHETRWIQDGLVTEEYNYYQTAYRYIVQQYLLGITSLSIIDERLATDSHNFIPSVANNYERQNDTMNLTYFYMNNVVHIERLTPAQLQVLTDFIVPSNESTPSTDASKHALRDMILTTYERVLSADERPGIHVEYYPDIHGAGILPGNSLLFTISIATDIATEQLMVQNRILSSLQNQLRSILEPRLHVPVHFRLNYLR